MPPNWPRACAEFSSTATLGCAGFAALNKGAQPRVAVLLNPLDAQILQLLAKAVHVQTQFAGL